MRRILALLLLLAGPAAAQEFPVPGRTVTLLGGFAAGTPGDVYLRLIAPLMSQSLGVPVVVEARVGATGNLAMEAGARAAPDGHTVSLVSSGQLAINPAIFPRMPIDTQADLAPVMTVFEAANVLTVSTAQRPQYTDCRALMAAIRAQPGRLNYASSGSGASTHLAAAQFGAAHGLDLLNVPYRGGPLALTALLAGEVDIFFYQTGSVLEFWRRGEVRLLAVTSRDPQAVAPGVPTVAEACRLPGFESTTWYGWVVHARTPPAVQARLSALLLRIAADPGIEAKVRDMGFTPRLEDPAQMRARIDADWPRWAEVVARSGARAD